MSIVNLFRDQIHIEGALNGPEFSTPRTITQEILMNSSGIVNETKGACNRAYVLPGNMNATHWTGVGVLMSAPIVDATPYRIQAGVVSDKAIIHIVIGFAPLAPTGTDDVITSVVNFPIQGAGSGAAGSFNGVVLVPGVKEGEPDYGKPIAIGVAISNTTTNPVSSYFISAQNLAKTAPQFASSMS